MAAKTARTRLTALLMLAFALGEAQTSYVLQSKAGAEKGLYRISLKYPQFKGTSPTIAFANTGIEKGAEYEYEQFVEAFNDSFPNNKQPRRSYVFTWMPVVSVAQPNLISVYFNTFQDTARTHPMRAFSAFSYGLVDGQPQQLTLGNLFRKDIDPLKFLSSIVIPDLKKQGAALVKSGEVKALDEELAKNFVLTPTALVFLFYTYQVGPYSAGPYQVKIPLADIKSKLDPNGPLGHAG